MASLAQQMKPAVEAPFSPFERRFGAEWVLLLELVALNPTRLRRPKMDDCTLYVELCGTPALSPGGEVVREDHLLRLEYPRFFPAVPLELYLGEPMQHPNIHPITGFVCLWEEHRVANTLEHAIHKTAAMLGWRLMNLSAEHVMQPQAVGLAHERDSLVTLLEAPLLLGGERDDVSLNPARPGRRTRLS